MVSAIDRVNSALVDTLTSNIVITPAGSGATIDDASSYLTKIRGTVGVAAATAVYHVGTQASYGASSGSWTVDAIDPASFPQADGNACISQAEAQKLEQRHPQVHLAGDGRHHDLHDHLYRPGQSSWPRWPPSSRPCARSGSGSSTPSGAPSLCGMYGS